MIAPYSKQANLIDTCIKNGYSFRIGVRGICIDCLKDKESIMGWIIIVPRAGMKTINCDTIEYDFEFNTLICGVEAGYVPSIEFDMDKYDNVRVLDDQRT